MIYLPFLTTQMTAMLTFFAQRACQPENDADQLLPRVIKIVEK
jgi:hypothetical protein